MELNSKDVSVFRVKEFECQDHFDFENKVVPRYMRPCVQGCIFYFYLKEEEK